MLPACKVGHCGPAVSLRPSILLGREHAFNASKDRSLGAPTSPAWPPATATSSTQPLINQSVSLLCNIIHCDIHHCVSRLNASCSKLTSSQFRHLNPRGCSGNRERRERAAKNRLISHNSISLNPYQIEQVWCG